MRMSQRACDKIIEFEVSSADAYRKLYQRPEWPGGASGLTVGIGYDLGMCSATDIRADWSGRLPDSMVASMMSYADIHGGAARSLLAQSKARISVPWAAAMAEFEQREIPRWETATMHALPNCEMLSGDSFGMLASISYNRGAGGWTMVDDRHREMRAIRAAMAARNFRVIPGLIRSSKRLWPGVNGLLKRRDTEAEIFDEGLTKPAIGPMVVTPPIIAPPPLPRTTTGIPRTDIATGTTPPPPASIAILTAPPQSTWWERLLHGLKLGANCAPHLEGRT